MEQVSIYDIMTGKILKQLSCPSSMISAVCEAGEEFYLNCPGEATHIINNKPVTIIPEPVRPTNAEIVAFLTRAVQAKLDAEALTHNYDGILSLCSYASSLDPVFKAEGQAGVEWRDACWRVSYQVMSDVKAGIREVPTSEGLIAELPTMVWPA